jgi:hypothetical protein
MMTDARYSGHASCVEWARSLGSSATTLRGAVRFLRARLKPSAYFDLGGYDSSFSFFRRIRVSKEDEEFRTNVWRYQCLGKTWMVPGAECLGPAATAKEIWRAYYHHLRMARRADRAAAERGITWTQEDAIHEAERLTRIDVARCHEAALREEARRRKRALDRRKRAMGRRTVRVIDRSSDASGRPLILWWRRGEAKRSLTGWDDGHIWTVKVPSRLSTAREALHWLIPDGLSGYWDRQGEWYFVPVDSHTAGLCYRAQEDGSVVESEEKTEHGTWHQTTYSVGEWTQTRHRAQCVVVARKSGEVVFIGRKGHFRTHYYTSKPRLYVRGSITAPDHAKLFLDSWCEVIGNRAVGAPAAIARGLD